MGAFFSVVFAFAAPSGAEKADPEAFSRLYFGLQLATDRDAQRAVELAEELLAEGRSSEAAPLLARLFASDSDALDDQGVSLRRRMLAAIQRDTAGVTRLRAVLAAQHRRELAEARDPSALRRHLAAYPPELFGAEALRRLGRLEEDAGRYVQASIAYREALKVSQAEGDTGTAKRLMELVALQQARTGLVSDASGPQLEEAAVVDAVLEATRAVRDELAQGQPPAAWLGAAGGPGRRATAPGPPPIAWRDWRAVLGEAPESGASQEAEALTAPCDAVLVAGMVTVAADQGLVAHDAATGRKRWKAPFPPSASEWRGNVEVRGLSTDTSRLYAVTPSDAPDADPEPGIRRRFGDSLFRGDEATVVPNRLAAYDPATGGKLVWELDGGAARGPVRGARFLGPPATRDGLLYLVAEQEQTIRLLEIDAATGAVLWSQPLVRCEREAPDVARALTVEPTLGDRYVYCPTGRGVIAAVDPLLRRVEWLASLAVDESDTRPAAQAGWGAGRSFGYGGDEGPTWRRCRLVLAGEKLVAACPELSELQAFDAMTGELGWRREAPDARYLAHIDEELVLTLHDRHATLWNTADGKPLSKAKLADEDSPAGEGLLLGNRYLAPLRSGRFAMLALDREAQSVTLNTLVDPRVSPWSEPSRLGNLAYHRGAVVSVSASTVESFRQPDAERATFERALAELSEGDAASAASILKPLTEGPEADAAAREAYAVARLASARADGSLAAEVGEELPKFAAGHDVEASAAALRIAAAAARNDGDAVLDEARRIAADPAVATAVLTLEPGWQVVARRYATERLRRFGAAPELLAEVAGSPVVDRMASPTGLSDTASLWSSRQVTAKVSDALGAANSGRRTFHDGNRGVGRGSRDPGARVRRVSFQGTPSATAPASWTLESRGGDWVLVGATPQGDRVFSATLPGDPGVSVTPLGSEVGEPRHLCWGKWHALRQDSGCIVVETPEGIAWETTQLEEKGWPPLASSHDGSESPVAVGAWGVVTLVDGLLACRELATGALAWRREVIPDSERACRVLSVGDELFVALGENEGLRVSAWSGQQLGGPWNAGNPRQWRHAAGGNLLAEVRTPAGRRLELSPISRDGEAALPLWGRVMPSGTLVALAGEVGYFLDGGKKLTALDLARAAERYTVALPSSSEEPVRALRVRERLGRLLVEVDRTNPVIDRARGVSSVGEDPLLTGELHCLDLLSGAPLWARPAEVDRMAVLESAAASAPVVLLARRRIPASSDERAEALYALVTLDLATGGTLYRNHELPAGDEQEGPVPVGACHELVGSPKAPAERLLVRIGRSWVTLETTEKLASPRPVSLARVEDPEASQPLGTREIGQGVERLLESLWEGDDD